MKKYFESFFDDNTKFTFASSIIVMLMAHGFCFMNLMYSHDSLYFANTSGLGKVGLGRWLYPFFVHRRLMATPWMMGLFSILYVSLAVVLVAKVFDLSKMQGLSVGILFASNVTLTALFCTYINDADADCFGLLLACFAVYAFKKFPRIIRIVVPIVSLSLCLALYQAYICVAVGLFLILLICESSDSNNWKDVFNVFLTAIKELMVLLFGAALYIPLMHAASKHYGIELSTAYNGPGKLSSLKLSDVINDIPVAYSYFRDTFFNITEYNTISVVRTNWLMLILLLISLVIYVYCHREFLGSLVIVIPCLLIMPLGLNAIHLVSFGTMHQLMIFAFCIIYLLPQIISNKLLCNSLENVNIHKVISHLGNAVGIVSFLAIVYIGYSNIVYSNGAYVYKKLVYDNTELHAQTIWKDINSIDGYNEGETQVVFMGEFSSSKVAYSSSVGTRYLNVLTGASNTGITYPGTANYFYYNILGRGLKIVHNDAELLENPEYTEMPAYPKEGYCKMIGDRVVVRLQN